MPKISDLPSVVSLDINDVAAFVSKDNSDISTTMKVKVSEVANKVVNNIEYGALNTTDKKIIGAINEVNTKASQFDNMTATASGSIATFSDGGDNIPVKSFECEIVAQQASGTPTPVSPLPISGFSQADISVCGKNLCNWKVNTTSSPLIISLPKGTYTISSDGQSTFGYWYFRFTDINGNVITDNPSQFGLSSYAYSSSSQYFYGGNNRTDVTFILPDNGYTVQIGTLNGDGTKSAMLAQGSTATPYEPFKGNTYLVEFGQTIYGGRLIYSNGQWAIEATHGEYVFDGTETPIEYGSGYRYVVLSGKEGKSYGQDEMPNLICNEYNKITRRQIQSGTTGISITGNTILLSTNAPNGVQVVYELATPVIIPITSATRVKTISGANNIFSNTGDVELEYFTNKADEIAELIEAEIASMSADYHAYSTDEQIVGRWIDGNTIYEKVVDLGSDTYITQNQWVQTMITGISNVIQCSAINMSGTFYPLMASIQNDYVCLLACRDGNPVTVRYVILQYTKSSSNTRSLNLSKGIEEKPIEEKAEDVKEEEIKEDEK